MNNIKTALIMIKRIIVFIWETFIHAFKTVRSPRESIKQIYGISFYRNSGYLVANSGITLLLGLVFNILIARIYSASDVGYGSALISVLTFLSFAGTLGFGYYVVRYLPAANNKTKLLNSLLTIASLAGAVACLIFLSGISWWSPRLLFLVQKPYFFIAFVIFGVTTTVYSIITSVFISFRMSGYTLLSQGIIASALELVLVIVMSVFGVFGIFASQGIALAVSLVICLLIFLPRIIPHYRPIPAVQWNATRETLSYSSANFASDGLGNLPVWVLSLLVLNNFGAETNAYFYMAWTMSGALLAIAYGISTSLFAEGAHESRNMSRDLIRSLKLVLLVLVPATVIMVVFGDKFLLLYGGTYSKEGTQVLRLFSLAALPSSINFLYFSLARIEKWLKSLIFVSGAIALITIVSSYVLMPHFGIIGVGVSRLFAQTILLFFTVPKLMQRIKKGDSSISS